MNPISSISSFVRNYFNFSGRATRGEYWWPFLIVLVVGLALISQSWRSVLWTEFRSYFIAYILFLLLTIAVLLPVVYLVVLPAATVRRLHDRGESAHWLLLCVAILLGWGLIVGGTFLYDLFTNGDVSWDSFYFLMVFGGIWALMSLIGLLFLTIILALPGNVGPNRYGPDPLRPELGEEWMPLPARANAVPPESDASSATGENLTSLYPLSEPAPASQPYCTQCGTQLQPDARFCTYCGTAV